MASHTITAMFNTRPEAQAAVEALQRDVGLTSVRILANSDMTGAPAGTATNAADSDRGFFASLRDMFVPDEDRSTYAEGVRRGSILVTASVEDSKSARVMDLLEQHGAVDLDAEEQRWKEGGWTGSSTTTTGDTTATRTAATFGATTATAGALPRVPPATATTQASAAGRAIDDGATQSIQLAEESLVIGKRDVSHGRVKIRSYVVETPVSEQVRLREETVSIERRPTDRAIAAGEDLFRERTIEATEVDEAAVVSKEARVREEIVLHKDVTERTETVTDTVRRTEVEIDGDHASATRTATATTTTGLTGTGTPAPAIPVLPTTKR